MADVCGFSLIIGRWQPKRLQQKQEKENYQAEATIHCKPKKTIVYKMKPILIKFGSYCPEYTFHRVL